MAKWTRRWKPIWIPYLSNFQKAYVEEWEQEVSDDPLPEHVYHSEDSVRGLGVPTHFLSKKC